MSDYIDGLVAELVPRYCCYRDAGSCFEHQDHCEEGKLTDFGTDLAHRVAFAAKKRVMESAHVCEECRGSGFDAHPSHDHDPIKCPFCHGRGIVFAPPTGEGKEEA